ncbi:MAG: ABC transporter permease [Capsulimonadaceae bacterium]
MLRYLVRRVLYAVPILIGVMLFTFFLFYMSATPAQMARRNISAKNPSHAQIERWITQHGYDKPLSKQFTIYISDLFRFRFGKSDTTNEDIVARLRSGLWPSTQLALLIFIGSLITDVFFAIYFAYYRGTYIDNWGRFVCVLMMSITYILYIIGGQYVFGKLLRLWPIAGYRWGAISWEFMLLPAVVGILSGYGGTVRLYRTFVLDEIGQDYVRTARAKGVSERSILFRHVLKNAAIPIITSVIYAIPFLITGNLLLESFFGIPGVGSVVFDAINSSDFATIRATTFMLTIVYILSAILTDCCYAWVDPRVRLE